MTDCGSLGDALGAAEAGANLISTTLSGHTGGRAETDGPELGSSSSSPWLT